MKPTFFAAFFLSWISLHADPKTDERAAVVNGAVITRAQVNESLPAFESDPKPSIAPDQRKAKIDEIRKRALDELIDQQLVRQEFQRAGLTLSTDALSERSAVVARKHFGKDPAETESDRTQRWRRLAEDSLMREAVFASAVKREPIISDQQIAAFYHAHRVDWISGDEVKLRMLKMEAGLDPARRRRLLSEIRDKIVGGADFARLTQIYSEDSTQDKGGDWGWVKRGYLYPASLERAVFSLAKGQLSEIVEFNQAFYLLLAEDRKEGETKSLEQLRLEIRAHLQNIGRQKIHEDLLQELRKKAEIKIFQSPAPAL